MESSADFLFGDARLSPRRDAALTCVYALDLESLVCHFGQVTMLVSMLILNQKIFNFAALHARRQHGNCLLHQ
jgi:hypothetical protein